MIRAFLLALALVVGGMVHASASHMDSTWLQYRERGSAHIHTVVIRARCISAEDSAAHLRLRSYSHGIAVYGCTRSGY